MNSDNREIWVDDDGTEWVIETLPIQELANNERELTKRGIGVAPLNQNMATISYLARYGEWRNSPVLSDDDLDVELAALANAGLRRKAR
jgi:hypothetical protein